MQNVGVLGSGDVAQVLSAGLKKYGYTVKIGSRSADKVATFAAETGIGAGTFAEVAAWADALVLSVKGSAALDVVRQIGASGFAGKTVIDTTNAIADEAPEDGVLRVFTGPMLVTLGSAIALQGFGWIKIELPPWLLAVSYAIVGWTVGLGFPRSIVGYALRSLPVIVASSVAVIALCAAFGAVMVVVGGIDPMTAYLATSPGGADSIAIIAASTTVNMRFVMAMQITRLVVVMLIAPTLSRWIVRLVGGAPRLEA